MWTLMTTAPPWGVEIVKLLSGVISYVDNTNIWRQSVAGLLIIFSRSAIDLSKLFFANFCDPLLRNEPCGRLQYHWVSHDIHNTNFSTWGRGTAHSLSKTDLSNIQSNNCSQYRYIITLSTCSYWFRGEFSNSDSLMMNICNVNIPQI